MAKSHSSGGIVLAVVIVALLAAGGWYWFSHRDSAPPEYATAKIGRGTVTQTITATGGLQPVTSVDVSSQISGLINSVQVDFNSPVKQGQVLATIDPATYQSRLRQAEADLANTTANRTLVRLNTERTRELRTKNLVTQQDLDQAEALLAQADAQAQIKQALVDSARVDLDRCTIKSPIDGIVIDRLAEVGKTVAASLNAPTLFTIANDLSKMQINANVAEADIGSVADGQDSTFTVDAYPGRQFHGRVSQIRNAPITEQNVVTYITLIDVSNADLKLKPGMTANVSIIIASRPDALRLPNAALRVRIPDDMLAPAPAPEPGTAPAPKPLTDDERKAQMAQLMRDAGFTPGSGPPSTEVREKMRQLAKERGIDLSALRGHRGGHDATPTGPVTRTVYRLVRRGNEPPQPQALTVKLGINDGSYTEIIDGLKEGDEILTSAFFPEAQASAPSSSPFGGGRRRF
ncbi:efflux RND transporter periplasmic adaptor subunit [Horticoccus luteus]|uniref:Efflux RND transporter periplasmic adaptor subunit n=1 Tax=Horticoccus luteus TaxID=2862869 RepID=A0A8F9TTP7_9BACT|nr:efflux RND transporter periplasmic adaptor subunit [Horticoccus luteus]QYM77598.1 efflux RND transporter periplasmic adaptor subunit [Horticoccus luteus]